MPFSRYFSFGALRILLVLGLVVAATGCALSPVKHIRVNKEPKGFKNTAGTMQWEGFGVQDADARLVPLVAQEEKRINGVRLQPGDRVYGAYKSRGRNYIRESWVFRPRYSDIKIWGSGFAYVKPVGSDTYHRVDRTLLGHRRTSTNITEIDLALIRTGYLSSSGFHVGTRPSDRYPGDLEVVFFDHKGRETGRVDGMANLPFTKESQPVYPTQTAEAFIVRHRDPELEGQFLDIVYSPEGIPLSPPMEPFSQVNAYNDGFGERVIPMITFPVDDISETDGYARMHWPLMNNGMIVPLPEDCMGLRGIRFRNHSYQPQMDYPVRGWAVLWRTEHGPLWALLPWNAGLEEFVNSRDKAIWRDFAMTTPEFDGVYHNDHVSKVITIARRYDSDYYVTWQGWPHEERPRIRQTMHEFPSQAMAELARAQQIADERRREEQRQRYEAWVRTEEEMRQARIREAELLRLARENARFEVNLAIQRGNYASALNAARASNDGHLIRSTVFSAIRAGKSTAVSDADLSRAMAVSNAEDRKTLQRLLDDRRRSQWQMNSHNSGGYRTSSFFTPSSSSTSSPSSSSSDNSYQRSMQRVNEYRWNARMNYLSGRSSSLPYGW